MTKLKTKQRNLNYLSSLLLLVGFVTCGTYTPVYASTTITIKKSKQANTITGKVVGANDNMPIPGVNIIVKGSKKSAVTDFDGNFSISNINESDVLVFSFVGYSTQEILVKGQKTITIKLKSDAEFLDQIVVVGYGTSKKSELTGAVATVSGKDLVKTPVVNVASSLQGRLPGLTVSQRTGEPGNDDPSILVRATATTGDNAVLIVIDGVPRSGIGQLNSEDIESVSVLKGASAAIYGARAANGVIIVTTKKGKSGKPEFSFSYNSAFTNPTQEPDLLNSVDYAKSFNEAQWYDSKRPAVYTPYYSDAEIEKFGNGSDRALYPNTNWYQEVAKKNAQQQRISLQVNGGSDNTRYLLSFASINQDGNYKNNPTAYKQYNMRAKFDVDVTKNLNFGVNINGVIRNKVFSSEGVGTNFYNIIRASPTLVAVYDNGLIAPGRLGQSPLLLDQRGYNHTDEIPINTTFTGTYKIPYVEGLRINTTFNYDFNSSTNKTWSLPYTSNQYNVVTGNYDVSQVGITAAQLTDRYDKGSTKLFNYQFIYDKTVGNHKFSAMIGQEQQVIKTSFVEAKRINFVSPAVAEINVGSTAATDKDNSGSSTEKSYNNYFSTINYGYKSKYFLDVNLRTDGSQNFKEGNRYARFYSISGAWRISEENFIKNNFKNIDQLKLRASQGTSGNDRIDPYQYLQNYTFGSNYVFGTTDVPGVNAGVLANPDVTWEKSNKLDVGFDSSFWKGLLGIEFTYWTEHRYDILETRNLSIPNILGLPGLPKENIGIVDSNGYELVLSHSNKKNALKYTVTGNVAYADAKVIYKAETPPLYDYQKATGYMVGADLYYQADGIYHTQAELDSSVHNAGTQVGDIKIIDVNGDGKITDLDRVRTNTTNAPKYVFGFNTAFEYKNFDLNVFFQGQAEAVNYDDRFASLALSEVANSYSLRAADRWTVDNPNGTMPRARDFVPGQNTFFLQDATFVRLKSLELGYSLPKNLISKIGFTQTRIYLSGSNVFTWAKEIKHVDPEISGRSTYYPVVRTLNVGVNVKF